MSHRLYERRIPHVAVDVQGCPRGPGGTRVDKVEDEGVPESRRSKEQQVCVTLTSGVTETVTTREVDLTTRGVETTRRGREGSPETSLQGKITPETKGDVYFVGGRQ